MPRGERDAVCQTCKNAREQSTRQQVGGRYVRVRHPCPVCRPRRFRSWVKKNS